MELVGLGEYGMISRIKAKVEVLVFFENMIKDFPELID